ncbi:hypothetical protein ACHAXR_000798 [Thalassiosira sp. AJA248-18]
MSEALPMLPSIRAKELERASAASQTNKSLQSDDFCKSADATVNAPLGSYSGQRDSVPSADIRPNAPISQSETKRSEELATLHRKEQKLYGGFPPLESSVACNAIHHHISTTSAFLNSFVADVNASHEGIDHKLTTLENQMALLESKIASMPDLFPEETENDHDGAAGAEGNGEDSDMESDNGGIIKAGGSS